MSCVGGVYRAVKTPGADTWLRQGRGGRVDGSPRGVRGEVMETSVKRKHQRSWLKVYSYFEKSTFHELLPKDPEEEFPRVVRTGSGVDK